MTLRQISGTCFILIAIFAGLTDITAQKGTRGVLQPEMAIPVPVVVDGNPTCADVNASSNSAFSHISEDWGLKINRGGLPAFNQTFTFVSGSSTELQGGAGPSPGSFVQISVNDTVISWASNRAITAVIVKGGDQANVYAYNPASLGGFPSGYGANLNTGSQNAISHLVFCFESLAPSAAQASVSGRVVNSFGYGIANVGVVITDVQHGTTWSALTNPFGYYRIDGPEVGNFYMITVNHKRYSFADGTRTFTLNDNLIGMDFMAAP